MLLTRNRTMCFVLNPEHGLSVQTVVENATELFCFMINHNRSI